MSNKAQFASKIGLIAATVGSAVGLGNVWRFPAEAQANGGAAFLLLYVVCVAVMGIPVMLAEFSLGRGVRSDAVGVFKLLAPGTRWWIVGALGIMASYLILSFYMVVAGWTLEYLWKSLTGELYSLSAAVGLEQGFQAKMQTYLLDSSDPIVMTIATILINLVILMMGVQKGIEKMSNIMMPVLFVLLLVFAGVVLTLPGSGAGVAYFLSPDFTKLTPEVAVNALGQAFFSLSLGMGILVTYAGYFPSDTNLTRTSLIVSGLSLLVAVLMGIIIFPAVMAFGLDDHSLQGATLVFVTLPEVFTRMPATELWSVLFFLLLLVAAVTSTISLGEVAIAFMQERFGMGRVAACVVVMAPLFVLSPLCSLSQSGTDWLQFFDTSLFDVLDSFTTNVMLPVVALGTCVFVGWRLPQGYFFGELTNGGLINRGIYRPVRWIVRYLAPVLILFILIAGWL